MRRVSENPMDGTVTYELSSGEWITFDARAVRDHGLEALLRASGHADETKTGCRKDVMQGGRKIGTVPEMFEPMAIKSTSPWYQVRAGDFVRDGDAWVAARTLGPGDLEAVPGFVWERNAK